MDVSLDTASWESFSSCSKLAVACPVSTTVHSHHCSAVVLS